MKINSVLLVLLLSTNFSLYTAERAMVSKAPSLTPGQLEEIYGESFTYPSDTELTRIFSDLGADDGGQASIEKNMEFILNHRNAVKTVGYALNHIPVSLCTIGTVEGDYTFGVSSAMNKREEYLKAIFPADLFAKLKRAGLIGAVSSAHSVPLPTVE